MSARLNCLDLKMMKLETVLLVSSFWLALSLNVPSPSWTKVLQHLITYEALIRPGIHPLRIAKGYEMAAKVATSHIAPMADVIPFNADDRSVQLERKSSNLQTNFTDTQALVEAVMTTLGSKIINRYQRKMAEVNSIS